MNNYEKVKSLLKSITEKPRKITFDMLLSDYMGDNDGAIVLNQLIFWSDKSKDPDSWIYKTYAEWYEETRLSKYIIYSRTELLKELGIVETRQEAHPYRNATQKFYRFNMDKFIVHFTTWATETLSFSPLERQKFDEATSKILRGNVKNFTEERQKLDAPIGAASYSTEESISEEYKHKSTYTPPPPPMEQLPPDKEEVVITNPFNPETITQRMNWLIELGIKSNEIRNTIATDPKWTEKDFEWAIETRNSYIENGKNPPDGGLYAKYFLKQPNKKGHKIVLWKDKATSEKIQFPEISPDLMAAINNSCQPERVLCPEWTLVKDILREQMTQATYNTNIHKLECKLTRKPLEGENNEKREFTLYGDKLSLEWVENRLENTIKRAFQQAINEEVDLAYKEK